MGECCYKEELLLITKDWWHSGYACQSQVVLDPGFEEWFLAGCPPPSNKEKTTFLLNGGCGSLQLWPLASAMLWKCISN
jgi:hypothetical protein